jgi:hypothetical protein
MDDPIEARLRSKYLRARTSYVVKTRPIRDIEYLEGIHELAVERKSKADVIWMDYNHRLHQILDEFGFAGPARLTYYNFGRRLLSFYLNFSENLWHNFTESLKQYYVTAYKLNPECLDRIIELTISFMREFKEGPVVEEGGGQEA